MRTILFCTCILSVCLLPASATPQVCGDATGNGSVSLSDVAFLLSYLMEQSPEPAPQADCDGVPGMTISDAARLVDYLFVSFGPLDCTLAGSYSFAPSPNDTVFLPRLANVPLDINHVAMPVITKFESGVDGEYLVLLGNGMFPDGVFTLTEITYSSVPIATAGFVMWSNDTAVMVYTPLMDPGLTGVQQTFTLQYDRQSAGPSTIAPFPIDRTDPLRFAIERDGDLRVPWIAYYDYQLPPDTLTVSPAVMNLTLTVGDQPLSNQLIDLDAAPRAVACSAFTDVDWITILDPGPHTTPHTLAIEIDPDGLSAGSYTGLVTIAPIDPTVVSLNATTTVQLTLEPLILYPWGDLNCDGKANLTDLTLMVGVLFLNWDPPPPCGN